LLQFRSGCKCRQCVIYRYLQGVKQNSYHVNLNALKYNLKCWNWKLQVQTWTKINVISQKTQLKIFFS
jgi:hypothetical protein